MSTPNPSFPALNPALAAVTQRIEARSKDSRAAYLAVLDSAKRPDRYRGGLGCANMAHAFAAMPANDKLAIKREREPNIGIVTSYNDMLSAHQPYADYPEQIKAAARKVNATAQVAGGVPAMCDGVTQGEDGMELSLFSRDVIALSTAVALSHNVFDATLCLGICDKIVPGLVMGALQFGHLPTVFVPAGPMTTGLSNKDKARVRQQYALGLATREELLEAEQAAYHGAGTCTFYGTANSNQMLMEIMGLQLPGSSFVNPDTPLRHALTAAAAKQAVALSQSEGSGMGYQVNAKVIVNGIVGLLATGGSTNHTLHLVAMARAAGILINWDDFSDLSAVVPLLARIYPNGSADVNHFAAAGGMGFLIAELLGAGLLHADVQTVMDDADGRGLHRYATEPWFNPNHASGAGSLAWHASPATSGDEEVLRPMSRPFSLDGGLKLLQGNIGRAVVKTSAVAEKHRTVRAPAVVVNDQKELLQLFKDGKLERDFVAVVRFQGPKANGMPELHKLTPVLAVLQDKGFKVALVTDGRMSGASGKVPAAIHVSPEALSGGMIGKIRDGDIIELNANTNRLHVDINDEELAQRTAPTPDLSHNQHGTGRDLFALFRQNASAAEEGASPLFQ